MHIKLTLFPSTYCWPERLACTDTEISVQYKQHFFLFHSFFFSFTYFSPKRCYHRVPNFAWDFQSKIWSKKMGLFLHRQTRQNFFPGVNGGLSGGSKEQRPPSAPIKNLFYENFLWSVHSVFTYQIIHRLRA